MNIGQRRTGEGDEKKFLRKFGMIWEPKHAICIEIGEKYKWNGSKNLLTM